MAGIRAGHTGVHRSSSYLAAPSCCSPHSSGPFPLLRGREETRNDRNATGNSRLMETLKKVHSSAWRDGWMSVCLFVEEYGQQKRRGILRGICGKGLFPLFGILPSPSSPPGGYAPPRQPGQPQSPSALRLRGHQCAYRCNHRSSFDKWFGACQMISSVLNTTYTLSITWTEIVYSFERENIANEGILCPSSSVEWKRCSGAPGFVRSFHVAATSIVLNNSKTLLLSRWVTVLFSFLRVLRYSYTVTASGRHRVSMTGSALRVCYFLQWSQHVPVRPHSNGHLFFQPKKTLQNRIEVVFFQLYRGNHRWRETPTYLTLLNGLFHVAHIPTGFLVPGEHPLWQEISFFPQSAFYRESLLFAFAAPQCSARSALCSPRPDIPHTSISNLTSLDQEYSQSASSNQLPYWQCFLTVMSTRHNYKLSRRFLSDMKPNNW